MKSHVHSELARDLIKYIKESNAQVSTIVRQALEKNH